MRGSTSVEPGIKVDAINIKTEPAFNIHVVLKSVRYALKSAE